MTERERALLDRIEALLASDEHHDNALRGPLDDLYHCHLEQNERLKRLASIADGFQRGVREDLGTSQRRLERQLRRQIKLSRIADGYQELLLERNQTLSSEATRDPLTQIANRRGLHDELRRLVAAAIRHQRPFTLAMLDIDHFKRFNDTMGHEVGDQALVAVANGLGQTLRLGDLLGRWGGEEFLIALPGAPIGAATPLFDRLRERLLELEFTKGGQTLALTVSIGATEHRDQESYETTLRRADAALYEAKREGRDRWKVAD
ncbi:diguanylate cyclase [Halomonas sp. V046]|uniref:diguanylate cyclase n=1 Tax=Halomonas sp. V046 TaxID=3459611 RepID=UPI0040440501